MTTPAWEQMRGDVEAWILRGEAGEALAHCEEMAPGSIAWTFGTLVGCPRMAGATVARDRSEVMDEAEDALVAVGCSLVGPIHRPI